MSATRYLSVAAARAAYDQASAETGISIDDLMSGRRRAARGRWRVMQLMRERGASLPMIALRMQLHHTTVLYGLRQIGVRG